MLILTSKDRRILAAEGREIKERIEALGYPRVWGMVPEDILADTRAWQKRCAHAGLSAATVYEKFGDDRDHISASEVLLIIDEALLQLEPPGMVGG